MRSPVRAWLLLLCLPVMMAAAAPTPGELLLDGQARQAFVARWAPAYVRVSFQAPLLPRQDPSFVLENQVLGALVQDAGGGDVYVVAPEHRLRGVDRATLVFSDGGRAQAKVVHPKDTEHVPMARLVFTEQGRSTPRPLVWAPKAQPTDLKGARAWGLEWALLPGASEASELPALVDTVIGEAVEPPLDRFWYVPVQKADGMALVDARGRLLCVVFRQVPGVDNLSLCAPKGALHTAPQRKP